MKKNIRMISGIMIFSLILLFVQIPKMGMAGAKKKSKAKNPVIQIIAPINGCCITLGEELEIMIIVRKGLKLKSVSVLCNERGIGMTDKSPYVIKWDTSKFKAGTFSLIANVHLDDGRTIPSSPVEITLEGTPEPLAPAGAVVKEGTPIILVTEQEMVSGKVKKGSVIHFRVDKDIIGPDGQILIPYDSTAYGKVLASRSHGMFGRPGKLDFALESVNAADGTSVPLRAFRDSTGRDAGGLVIVGGLLISPLFVLFCGRNVEIPKGTSFTAYINHDTMIAKPTKSRLASADLNIPRSATVTKPTEGSKVKKSDKYVFSCSISPEDDKAYIRIYLDGDLVAWQKGNFSDIGWKNAKTKKVKPGKHEIFAEVTFSSGHIVKSETVKFSIEE